MNGSLQGFLFCLISGVRLYDLVFLAVVLLLRRVGQKQTELL
jgi:hypothetical protein